METITTWLIDQAAAVVVLGVVIYFLYREWKSVNKRKDELVKEFTELAILWEKRVDRQAIQDDAHFKQLDEKLNNILNLLYNGKRPTIQQS